MNSHDFYYNFFFFFNSERGNANEFFRRTNNRSADETVRNLCNLYKVLFKSIVLRKPETQINNFIQHADQFIQNISKSSAWIEKLVVITQTGKSIVHSVKMMVWKNFLIKKIDIYTYIKIEQFLLSSSFSSS